MARYDSVDLVSGRSCLRSGRWPCLPVCITASDKDSPEAEPVNEDSDGSDTSSEPVYDTTSAGPQFKVKTNKVYLLDSA